MDLIKSFSTFQYLMIILSYVSLLYCADIFLYVYFIYFMLTSSKGFYLPLIKDFNNNNNNVC